MVPDQAWQWPTLAALLLVIGWLLYREWQMHKGGKDERREYVGFIENLVNQASLDRQAFESERAAQITTWQEMVIKSIESYKMMCDSISRHDEHNKQGFRELESASQQRQLELLRALEKIKNGH